MPIIIPDSSWYQSKSSEKEAPSACPYANVHKCPRHYASIYMLGKARMITSISDEKQQELDKFWGQSGLLPVIEEDDTGMSGYDGNWSSFSNFCPEVSFSFFRYYASYLGKYADEIDKDSGHRRAERERNTNDWRYEWGSLVPCHFLDCAVYNQVQDFNSKSISKFDKLAHTNVVTMIRRMEQCLDNLDPSGVLHAASNAFETMAKDILSGGNVENQTLGSFIKKYENTSALPAEIKSVVGEIYKLRNSMPLSGHGSTGAPNITMHDAIVISAATKFVVEIEYRAREI